MALGLLAGGQFFLPVWKFFGCLRMAGGAGGELGTRLGVHRMIIPFNALVFAIHAVMAARAAAFVVVFLAFYSVVAVAAFHVFLVGAVVERHRLFGFIHRYAVGGNIGLRGQCR